jgi:hypothetical protein
VLGCAWAVYANVFGTGVYPSVSGGNFDAPVIKRAAALPTPQQVIDNSFALLEPSPLPSAPVVSAAPSFDFAERFAASAPQGVASHAASVKPAEAPKLAEAPKPAAAPKIAEAPKRKEASPAPTQMAALAPLPGPRVTEPKIAKGSGTSFQDMAQRAKAAVLSFTGADKRSIVEKLWGKPPSQGPLLAYASADAGVTGGLGQNQNPALGGSAPYDRSTAVYDISAHTVYLPDGTKLEAHSGLGSMLDDPRHVNVRMHGATPPHIYELTPREALFHGVPALRMNPIGGEDAIFGRSGLLAHTYMLGPNGDSNGCVSFKDYNAFLNAYRYQGIKKLAVLARVE